MSRFMAGLGGGLGAIGGAVAGSYAGVALRGKMMRGDAEEAGMAIGAVLGATILAAIGAGAGSDAPKQVGTSGVGVLGEWGVGAEIAAPTMINPGEIWQLDFTSDKPVSSQQFFDLVSSFQGETDGKFKTLSFAPIDQTHFRTIVQVLTPQMAHAPGDPGDAEVVDGIKFTITDLKPYVAAADTTAGSQTVVNKKKLSTGEIVGIGAAGATVLGGIVYVATRKKPRRRRRS